LTGVVTESIHPGSDTLVTINQSYISAAPGGYTNNLSTRPLYAVEVSVYDDLGELLNDSPFRYVPDSKGNLLIDVAAILKANLIADFSHNLTLGAAAYSETNVYRKFYIMYREVWTGSAESEIDDSSNQFFAVLGAMQIPSANGGNMAIYSVPEVKFLTKLTTFVMWRGYPSLLGLIVNEDSGNYHINTGVDNSPAIPFVGQIIVYDLNEVIVDQTISDTTAQVIDDTPSNISEVIPVELRDSCENPIMLMGRNSLGGPLQWMFDENQEYTFDYGNGIKAKRMRLFADDLTINQWEALQDFFTLGEVYKNNIREFTSETIKTATRTDNQVYVIDPDGNMIGVIVVPRQPSTETKQVKHTFEIEIEYPELFA